MGTTRTRHTATARRRFADVTDRAYLRAAADVLDCLLQDIDRAGAGQDGGALRALTVQWRGWARARHQALGDAVRPRRPVLLEPATMRERLSITGEATTPVITAGQAETTGLCSALIHLGRGRAARAHVHHVTDVIIVVLRGAATTVWWDQQGIAHTLDQPTDSHLLIPAGTPHATLTLAEPVDALEIRSAGNLHADIDLLPGFDAAVSSVLTPPHSV
jgi:uncharacterized RmlC-like cupin family protein